MKRIAWIVTGCLLLASTQAASTESRGDSCDADADSKIQLPACLNLADMYLNDTYKELMSINFPLLDEYEKVALRREQLAWLHKRDGECHLKSSQASDTSETWLNEIASDKAKAHCFSVLTIKRNNELNLIIKAKNDEIEKARKLPISPVSETAAPDIPRTGKSLLDFVPRGFVIYEKVQADFNGDQRMDVALVLRPVLAKEFDPRPLIILLEQPGGGYVLSARNDYIAPTGLSSGIANPHGADVLKSKERSLLVQNYGGASPTLFGTVYEFRMIKTNWFFIAKDVWGTNTENEIGMCDGNDAPKPPVGWNCAKHNIHTDFRSGTETETWSFYNKNTQAERVKNRQQKIERHELQRFEEIQPEKDDSGS